MSQPRVLCVMLANGRPEMVERAVRSFHAQTYPEKELLIWDSAIPPSCISVPDSVCYVTGKSQSIGMMRNEANEFLAAAGWLYAADIDRSLIAHWDSDDLSHPYRLTDQVRLIQQTGADCVGYNEMLFWDTSIEGLRREYPTGPTAFFVPPKGWAGNAWLYRNPNPAYCIGTSLMYTREIWQRFPFPDCHVGEDTRWLLEKRIKRVAVSANANYHEPRMIASIHGSNTSSAIQPGAREWKRAAEFDSYCRETMKL